jgi:hypothetical protein
MSVARPKSNEGGAEAVHLGRDIGRCVHRSQQIRLGLGEILADIIILICCKKKLAPDHRNRDLLITGSETAGKTTLRRDQMPTKAELTQQLEAARNSAAEALELLDELHAYLNSAKFRCGDDLDGYVQVNDVLVRGAHIRREVSEITSHLDR